MRTNRLFLLSALLLAGGLGALAQPGSGGPAPAAAPTGVPIDGGVSLLLAGGAAYALRCLRRKPRQ